MKGRRERKEPSGAESEEGRRLHEGRDQRLVQRHVAPPERLVVLCVGPEAAQRLLAGAAREAEGASAEDPPLHLVGVQVGRLFDAEVPLVHAAVPRCSELRLARGGQPREERLHLTAHTERERAE